MIVIVCIDERGGMLFNKRRQSQDTVLRKRILSLSKGHRLLMNTYSAKQFAPDSPLIIDDRFLQNATADDYCFVETDALAPHVPHIDQLIIFNWNRHYPADVHLDLDLSSERWQLLEEREFVGSSHERISEQHYLPIRGGAS